MDDGKCQMVDGRLSSILHSTFTILGPDSLLSRIARDQRRMRENDGPKVRSEWLSATEDLGSLSYEMVHRLG